MARIFVWVFFGPFWIQLVVAAGLAWLGYEDWQHNQKMLQARQALLAAPAPAAIPIADFRRDPDAAVQEVNLRAVVATEQNTRLIERTNFIQTDEDVMVVLQDETAGVDDKTVRAVILLEPEQKDAWVNWVLGRVITLTPTGPVIEVAGLRSTGRNTSHVADVLRERGLKKADNFTYLEPFIDGRAAGLTHLSAADDQLPKTLGGASALFALIGVAKLLRRHGRKQPSISPGKPPAVAPALPEASPLARPIAPAPLSASPRRKARSSWPLPLRILLVSAIVFAAAWACLIGAAQAFLPKVGGQSTLTTLLPLIGGSAPLILVPLCLFVGLRSMWRTLREVVAFVPLRPVVGKAPAPATPLAANARPAGSGGPIQSLPTLPARLRGAIGSNQLMAWAPFMVGCAVFLLAPLVMNGVLGLKGFRLVTSPGGMNAIAAQDTNAPPLAGDGLLDLQLLTIGAVLVMAVIGWLLKAGILALGRKIDPQIEDPWARIEAERLARR